MKKNTKRWGILLVILLLSQSPEASNNNALTLNKFDITINLPLLPSVRFTALEL